MPPSLIWGMWISPNEGAKFWLSVLTEIHNRGVKDIVIACVDGLTGFPKALETVFPKTQVQLCIVHMVRNSVAFVPWQQQLDFRLKRRKERQEVLGTNCQKSNDQ